jgi:ComF family protein
MNIFIKLKKLILDSVFPISCLNCGREGEWLCYECLNAIPANKNLKCPLCQKNTQGAICQNCSQDSYLDGLLVATSYNQKVIQTAIQTLKYSFVQDLADCLGGFVNKFVILFDRRFQLDILNVHNSETLLTAVPLHKKRLLERGFNQAELLGLNISRQFEIPYQVGLISRKRYTAPQAQLTKTERSANISGAFVFNKTFKVSGKNVIIIDDVATTLSTLNECAMVLKQAGCKEVWGLVIARGS